MDELNLSEIEKKLNDVFSSGERLVFWYDTTGAFEDSVDDLKLGQVKVLHLTDRNAFRAKITLEHDDPESQYLVYAPFSKPDVSQNHLEDTLLYSRQFFADKLSLIAADLHIPMRLRGVLSDLYVFFGAGKQKLNAAERKEADKRTNAFIERAREMDLESENEKTISLIALCVAAEARNTTIDDLFYAVLTYGDIREQAIIQKLDALGLSDSFWQLCEERLGYSDPKHSLLRLVMSLFAIDTFKDQLTAVPNVWKQYAQDDMKSKASNIAVLLENMKNNVLYQEKYDELSALAAQELHASDVLSGVPMEELLHTSSFLLVDDLIIRWICEREVAEDLQAQIAGFSIPEICEERLRLHFGFARKPQYQALLAGFSLLHAVGFAPKSTLKELIESYTAEDYQIDTAYRKFITNLDQMEDTAVFEKLSDLLENIYRTDYLEKLVYAWNEAYAENAMHYVITEQSRFYSRKVSTVKEKVAVIVSDAFRYEAAKELCGQFREDPNMEASIEPMLTALPSITMVGMAELLPHDTITMTDGKTPQVLADSNPTSSTAYREKILQARNRNAVAIDYDSLKQMKSKELRSFTAGKEVIYIYHNRIDATGEAMKTENSVFDATAKTIDEIFGIVRTLSKSGNVYRFLITSDHGFIYTRRKLEETDKLENLAGKAAFTDRRFIISDSRNDADGVYSVSLGDALKNQDERWISLAKGMSVFKCGGGMNYVHGGASPQEMIVPCVFVKTLKGKVETEDVKFNLITDIRKVTNLKLKLDFYQEQPVSDIVKAATYRIRFEADDGEVISNEVLYTADSSSQNPGDRMVSLHFDIKKKAYGSDHKYFLRILKDETGAEVQSRQVIMDLPFTDDFGFGV